MVGLIAYSNLYQDLNLKVLFFDRNFSVTIMLSSTFDIPQNTYD